jgi:adenylate kinase family enzyme
METGSGLWGQGLVLKDAQVLLSQQPDFVTQKEWLREIVENEGYLIDCFPKFHCEFNCIEMVWAKIKCELRKTVYIQL